MRAVLQRVKSADVTVDGSVRGKIDAGLLMFLGIGEGDTEADIEWLVGKTAAVRIFEGEGGKMNRSVVEAGGGVLVISQFTLYGTMKKGSRPSFNRAAAPETAKLLYERFIALLACQIGRPVPSGVFAAHMDIRAEHDGPVTLVLDTRLRDF